MRVREDKSHPNGYTTAKSELLILHVLEEVVHSVSAPI